MRSIDGADLSPQQIIADVRSSAGPQMVPSRKAAEDDARALLDKFAGRMSAEQAIELGKHANRHYWGTGARQNRFLPGFSTPLTSQMTSDIDHYNQTVFELWKAEEEKALEIAERVLTEKGYLPGAGRSFPTLLLYLRWPERYCVWTSMLAEGLEHLQSGYSTGAGDLDAYLEFCSAAQSFMTEHSVDPVELDAILAEASRQAKKRLEEIERSETRPTIGPEAFEFLADLRANNSKEWFDANRDRYEADLRDPIAAVFETIAAEYMRDLDPGLITEVKRDRVLARMNKWTQGVPYYEHYWGAFSRRKKQEDVQLFININPEIVRFGLYLGSAPMEARSRLAGTARESTGNLVNLFEQFPDLRWGPNGQDDPIEVHVDADIATWANGDDPEVAFHLASDDPLIGSPDLVDAIGKLMVALHPLAAIAWGDDVEIENEPADETARPEYTFQELVADTHLPHETLEEWVDLLTGEKKAALFYGPPGTGKTWVARHLGHYLAGTEGDVETVQFHPSFSYEDFIEGLRPVSTTTGMTYEIRAGLFKEFCDRARGKEALHVFVIDEINRAELGAVLGEVMMLLEYRGTTMTLPYSQRPFSIPKNVVLLATMNTADRSLALVDFALRRRFHALRMLPDRAVLDSWLDGRGQLALQMFDAVQKYVADDDFSPGHSYWMIEDLTAAGLERVWRYELRPYLNEYWFESQSRLNELERAVLDILADET